MDKTNTDALAEILLEKFAERLVATTPNDGSNQGELVKSVVAKLRWEPRPDRNPPSILIMRRGSKIKGQSNVVASISSTGNFSDLYPSWEPILNEWRTRRSANDGSKVSHKGLNFGQVPGKDGSK